MRITHTTPSKNHSYSSEISDTKKPSFALLQPHIEAGHDLMPLLGKSKKPRDKNWRTNNYARTVWVRHMQADGNVGVRLSDTQLVLDIDRRSCVTLGGKIIDPIEQLNKNLGIYLDWAPTVITGNGRHVYFRKPAGLKIVGKLEKYPGIEFKSYGGYVVAAGSVHVEARRRYYAENSPLTGKSLKTLEAPVALLNLITKRTEIVLYGIGGDHKPEGLAEMLSGIDPVEFRDHDAWLNMMMASHHATGGTGVEEFIAWSISDPKYADHGAIIRSRWESLHAEGTSRITCSTLYKALHDRGKGSLIPLTTTPEEDFAGVEANDDLSF